MSSQRKSGARASRSRAKTGGAAPRSGKSEFTPKEISAARARLQGEIETANITSRRSRLAQAAGMGSVGGLSTEGSSIASTPSAPARAGASRASTTSATTGSAAADQPTAGGAA